MRQVFSSQRLENVEKVAELLREAGIEVRITNGRSYKGGRRGTFSYREAGGPQPAVWVVRSDDQVRAREILRDAGLLETTRGDSFVPSFRERPADAAADAAQRRMLRVKLILLAGIVVVGGLAIVRALRQDPAAEALKAHPLDGSAAAVPQALAAAVLRQELPQARLDTLCLAIDGRDPGRAFVEAMRIPRKRVVAASECVRDPDEDRGSRLRAGGEPALIVDVHAFRPRKGEGESIAGTVEYSAYHHRMSGRYKVLEVVEAEDGWRVVRTVKHVAM
ncbi:DUF2007 domain-containing protein [Vulcaniibacterium tengchongense]|uniref:Putative signal transducing protein n=1 Tax=Vulcaniibacterium tengchongense TaxID=1273429 RepID=A0A3N4VMV9_9GAMM|nr:DUF2007 domain-containing protein [Vulcaniibacterium tengchongense]RPE81159.1 putative signal transducing protein [Vulcaniibacterium tengchongense]